MQLRSLWLTNCFKVSPSSFIYKVIFLKSSLDFKTELFGYMLNYTKDLVNELVAARESESGSVSGLVKLIEDHNSGDFRDAMVGG